MLVIGENACFIDTMVGFQLIGLKFLGIFPLISNISSLQGFWHLMSGMYKVLILL
jgi:hypothetical protein